MEQLDLFRDLEEKVETYEKQTSKLKIKERYNTVHTLNEFVEEIIKSYDRDITVNLEHKPTPYDASGKIYTITYNFISKEDVKNETVFRNLVRYVLDNILMDYNDPIEEYIGKLVASLEKMVKEKMQGENLFLIPEIRTKTGSDYLTVYSPMKDFKEGRKKEGNEKQT